MINAQTQGVGIGLSTAESLTTSMGGRFKVENTQSKSQNLVQIRFSLLTTDKDSASTFAKDLETFKKSHEGLDQDLLMKSEKKSEQDCGSNTSSLLKFNLQKKQNIALSNIFECFDRRKSKS